MNTIKIPLYLSLIIFLGFSVQLLTAYIVYKIYQKRRLKRQLKLKEKKLPAENELVH